MLLPLAASIWNPGIPLVTVHVHWQFCISSVISCWVGSLQSSPPHIDSFFLACPCCINTWLLTATSTYVVGSPEYRQSEVYRFCASSSYSFFCKFFGFTFGFLLKSCAFGLFLSLSLCFLFSDKPQWCYVDLFVKDAFFGSARLQGEGQ